MNALRSLILFAPLLASQIVAIGQDADTLWQKGGNFNINFQQVGFNNWANGGEAALTLGTVIDYSANYKDENQTWKNSFQFAYGFQRKKDDSPRKNTDLIIISSEYGKNLTESWQLTASVDFRTQIANGYKYADDNIPNDSLVSKFLTPAYLQPSLGIGYKKEAFSATISPIAAKLTIVTDDYLSSLGAYGVEPGKKIRSQLGTNINLNYKKEIMENVTLKTNLLMFGDYNQFSYWDINWDLFIDFKINDFLSTNFLVQAIYDDDITGNSDDPAITGPALQLRNVLNIGFNLKF